MMLINGCWTTATLTPDPSSDQLPQTPQHPLWKQVGSPTLTSKLLRTRPIATD